MSMDDQRLAQLLRESTPEPPFDISLDAVVRQRNRRRVVAGGAVAVTTVLTLIAAVIGVPALLRNGTDIQLATPTDGLRVTYRGVTFDAPDRWSLGGETTCGEPADRSVLVGPSWRSRMCGQVPTKDTNPSWVWLTPIADMPYESTLSNSMASTDGSAQKLTIDGQPAYLAKSKHDIWAYTLTLPWLDVRAFIAAPDDAAARELIDRFSARSTSETLDVPEAANRVKLMAFRSRERGGFTSKELTGEAAAAFIRELRALEIRETPDPTCKPAVLGMGEATLIVYGPSREYRLYTVRSDCAETYSDTGVAGATTRTLLKLIDEQLK